VIFVDSSFWIAQRLARDARHADAVMLEATCAREALVTSSTVIGETWTFLRRRADHGVATRWLDRVRNAAQVAIERIDSDLEDEAWAWLRVHQERPYSFVDATSFALMRKLRIEEALAFGGDFAAAGFVELGP
jgi:predicted nucleic acid-binding protein